jgi:histidyl-tRNA synthetase
VLAGLDRLGIAYTQNPRLVRGLDYYTNTAFEFISDDVGAQSAIGGGGRYNGLIAELGGPEMPGVGFGLGTERIVLALENAGIKLPLPAHRLDAVVIRAGEEPEVVSTAQILLYVLRRAGLRADSDTLGRSLKNQLKWAGKINAANAIIIGKSELDRGIAVVRDLAAGTQQEVSLSELEQGKLTV